jgi:integrase
MRGAVTPAVQFPAAPLKTDTARTPIPIPQDLALLLSAAVRDFGGETVVTDAYGHPAAPWSIMRGVKAAAKIAGLPETFRFRDLRHCFASLLIASGADVKVVQARLRHGSAKTTLDTYGHIWPDKDETSRAVVADVLRAREAPSSAPADYLRTRRPS